MAKQKEKNVVDLLLRQHEEIRKLFARYDKSTGKTRERVFEQLRCLLAVHETAEEEIVHPIARETIGNGERIINARLKEERQAKELLQQMERYDVGSIEFESLFGRLRKAVETHADHEEHFEFPELLTRSSPEELRGMAVAMRAAEAIAPTHPHPGIETPMEHMAFGPIVAVMDRTRDAIRKARR